MIEWMHQAEIGFIVWLQNVAPWLEGPARLLTGVGNEVFYMLALPLVYWCIDRRLGVRLTLVLLLSVWSNALLKVLFDWPRPFMVDTRVSPGVEAASNGMPSGHTQNPVAFWGYLMWMVRHPLVWGTGLLMLVLVPLSRVVLGVHFPTDLLGGLLAGGAVLAAFIWLSPVVARWLGAQTTSVRLLVVVVPALLLVLLAGDDALALTGAAMLLGMGTGFVVERRWVRFTPAGVAVWRRALAWVLGIGVMMALARQLDPLLAQMLSLEAARVVRYTLIGLWGAAGAPALFVALRLFPQEVGMAGKA